MDRLRNGAGTTVDYIESLLFYILLLSDFCYLHPSTAARRRMAIDFFFFVFAKDEWEWQLGIKSKKRGGGWGGVGEIEDSSGGKLQECKSDFKVEARESIRPSTR